MGTVKTKQAPGDTVNQAHYTHYQTHGGKSKKLTFSNSYIFTTFWFIWLN